MWSRRNLRVWRGRAPLADKTPTRGSGRPPTLSSRRALWRASLPHEIWKLLAAIGLAALAYSQHAKPFCAGQPHSLPPTSGVLEFYPCNAGAAKRAVYLLRNIVGVYKDMLNLGPRDRWASAQLAVLVVRVVIALVLPTDLYYAVVTPCMSQIYRLIPLAYLLAVSYIGVAPSAAGHWYLTMYPALDFLSNVIFPVYPITECVYGAVRMIFVAGIWLRYGHLAAFGSANSVPAAGPTDAITNGLTTCAAPWSACVYAANTTTANTPAAMGSWADFHMETSLSYQLMLSVICTLASVVVEMWRGPPAHMRRGWAERASSRGAGDGSTAGGSDASPYIGPNAAARGDGGAGGADRSADGSGDGGIHYSTDAGGDAGDSSAAGCGESATAEDAVPCGPRPPQLDCQERAAPARQTFEPQPHPHSSSLVLASSDPPGSPSQLKTATVMTMQQQQPQQPGDSRTFGQKQQQPESSSTPTHDTSDATQASALPAAAAIASAAASGGDATAAPLSSCGQPRSHADSFGAGGGASAVASFMAAALSTLEGGHSRWSMDATVPGPHAGFTSGPMQRDSGLTASFLMGSLDDTSEYVTAEDAVGNIISLALGGAETSGGSTPDVTRLDQRRILAIVGGAVAGSLAGGGAEAAAPAAPATGAIGVPGLGSGGAVEVGEGDADGADGVNPSHSHQSQRLRRSLSSRPPPAPLQVQMQQQHLWQRSASESISAAAAVAAGIVVLQARRPTYVPRVRLVTTHIKIQGADPAQLQPGYSHRLEDVASSQGQQLMGVYVRAGCIELVLDSADWGEPKDSEAGEGEVPSPPTGAAGRDSGPLPLPLLPRPPAQPLYRSAPNTPSQLRRQQPSHPQQHPQQHQHPQSQAWFLQVQQDQDRSPGSVESRGSAGRAGLAPVVGSGRYGSSASHGSVHGSSHGAGTGDVDLGAVIRALRLPRNEGSAETTNDLASELDLDLEFGDGGASALSSGGSGGGGSSKEAAAGSGGRRAAPDVAPVSGPQPASGPTSTSLLQQLQQHQLHQQLQNQHQQQRQQQQEPFAPPPPSSPPSSASTARSISRQALILGGPRDPLAPGIVTLSPRVFAMSAAAGLTPAAATHRNRPCLEQSERPSARPAIGFTAVVRRLGATTAGAAAAGDRPSDAGAVAAAAPADVEFTFRARGDYLSVRTSRAAVVAVAAGNGGSHSGGAADDGGGGGGRDVSLPGMPLTLRHVTHLSDDVDMGGDGDVPRGGSTEDGDEALHVGADIYADGEGGYPAVPLWYESYNLELMETPQGPGLLLADLRLAPCWPAVAPPCAMPVVAVSNPAVAAELQSMVERWEGSSGELDDLLLDLGTWVHHVASQAGLLLAYSAVGSHAVAGVAAAAPGMGLPRLDAAAPGMGLPRLDAAAPGMGIPRLDARLSSLGRHLLAYAEACGWEATASSVRAELALFGLVGDSASSNSGIAGVGGNHFGLLLPPALSALPPLPQQHVSTAAWFEVPTEDAEAGAGAAGGGGGSSAVSHGGGGASGGGSGLMWRGSAAATHEGGFTPGSTAELASRAEAEEFRVYKESWISAQSWIIQLLDVVSMIALLFRGRHDDLLSPSNLLTLLACSIGTVTTAARLVMPYKRWLRLAEATKIPRHACYCATKFMIGVVGYAAPPGIASYELGAPVFIFESIIVPYSCLLSPLAAAVVGAVKVPIYMALWKHLTLAMENGGDGSGAPAGSLFTAVSRSHSLRRALAVAGLSVAVTAACHANIKAAFGRRKRRAAAAAAAKAAKAD